MPPLPTSSPSVDADQAVGGAHHSDGARAAVGQGDGADHRGAVLPVGAADHVVAVGQGRDAAAADLVAVGGPDQAIGGGNRPAGGAAVAAGPGDGADHGAAVLPRRAVDDIIAVGERGHAAAGIAVAQANHVAGGRADEAVGERDHAGRPGVAVAPGDGADIGAVVLPGGAADHIVAVGKRGHAAAADVVAIGRADETVGSRHGADGAAVADCPR